jgi:hypothetical protein
MSQKFIISEQDRKHIRGLYEQTQPNQQSKRLVKTSYGTANFTNIPNDKIQGMINSYINLVNRTIKGESVGAIFDYSIMQKFPEQFNPYKFLNVSPNDKNLVQVFMAIKNFSVGGGTSDLGKLGIVKPKFVSPLSIFNKPFDLGSLLDWWNNPSNKNIIEFFIGSEEFVPESATIFKNTKVPQIKVNVPQDFLTAYNEIQAKQFGIQSDGAAIFVNVSTSKGYKYVKTANGYVLSKNDRQ